MVPIATLSIGNIAHVKQLPFWSCVSQGTPQIQPGRLLVVTMCDRDRAA
jgi:hypothetical protein